MKEYNIEDKVFWAKYRYTEVKKVCPICFGKLLVMITLGNGDTVKTPCEYCQIGFSESRGYVIENEYVPSIDLIDITSKEVNETSDRRDISYGYSNYVLDGQIFDTKEEAEQKVQEMIKAQDDENKRRNKYVNEEKLKKISWHIGYHQRNIREAEKQIEMHKRYLIDYKKLVK